MRTDRTKALPPFFTQVIGSLPRPKLVRDLIDRRDSMPEGQYNGIMDEMVIVAIRLQEQAGLDVVSDGEWRRVHYLDEFLHRVGGHQPIRPFEHQGKRKYTMVVTGKMQGGSFRDRLTSWVACVGKSTVELGLFLLGRPDHY